MAFPHGSERDIPGFTGDLLLPRDPGYDAARTLFNGMIDRSPARIARCRTTAEVVAAVDFGRTSGMPVSVRGGGHGVTGSAMIDAGLCIDLAGLDRIEVDPVGRVARVGGGCRWAAVDAATQAHGLAVTSGRVSGTGVGGLTLGSGSGWIERKFGFTCDSLRSAEVVTADGRVVTASTAEHPDLFWGLRGGGGNFGIVTRFDFDLHPLGPIVLAGLLIHPPTAGGALLRSYREFMRDAPDEVGGGIAFITAPPAAFVPEPVRGHPVIGVIVTYVGDMAEGERVLAPLRAFGPPAVDMIGPMPYVAVQQMIDPGNQSGNRNYWSADFYRDLPDDAIDTLVGIATEPVSPLTQILVVPGGGAVARVPDDATAFGERSAPWNLHFLSMWVDPADDEANIAYTRRLSAAMKPWTTGHVYLNYIGDEGPDRVRSGFGPATFARLQTLKRAWDPENLFRHNQNIPPA